MNPKSCQQLWRLAVLKLLYWRRCEKGGSHGYKKKRCKVMAPLIFSVTKAAIMHGVKGEIIIFL
jgi:hypothetical protein